MAKLYTNYKLKVKWLKLLLVVTSGSGLWNIWQLNIVHSKHSDFCSIVWQSIFPKHDFFAHKIKPDQKYNQ